MNNIFVLKLGSSTVLHGDRIYQQIKELVNDGSKVIIVAGGAEAISRTYQGSGIREKQLVLKSGNHVRYTPPEDMHLILSAYSDIIIPKLERELRNQNISSYSQIAGKGSLVTGKVGKPLLAVKKGHSIIVRDSLYGKYESSNSSRIKSLLKLFDVIILTPPIFDSKLDQFINVDADMLAANVAINCQAAHLRFVTSTHGLLKNLSVPNSTIKNVYLSNKTAFPVVEGKMKQKIRAVKKAVNKGCCDVAITGKHQLANYTRFWKYKMNNLSDQLFVNMVSIPSVSTDEAELGRYLTRIKFNSITSKLDDAGNVTFTKGTGEHKIYLIGHIDTVQNIWPIRIENNTLYGRGSVDAKAPMATFVSALEKVKVPDDFQVICIGAVQEEVSSSKGASFIRDNYHPGMVIIGEPSGSHKLTLGYNGLFKLQLTCQIQQTHSAGKGSISSIDQVINAAKVYRQMMTKFDPHGLSSIQGIHHDSGTNATSLVLNFRVTNAAKAGYVTAILEHKVANITVSVLRNTIPFQSKRSNPLVNSFVKGFKYSQKRLPEFIYKSGTSDMNTIATKWKSLMLAYGPGNSLLDHTPNEHIEFSEYHQGINTLITSLEYLMRDD